ncbi:MAG: beta-lactamase family protein [Bacteroidia bacterium]|nr:beta-lactamase family protein [Bacteroidia bacterium]
MKRNINILFFLLSFGLCAQNPTSADKFLENYKAHYNQKNFDALEKLMDDKFMKAVGKENFWEMNWGFYVQMGPIQKVSRMKDSLGTARAWVEFENGQMIFEMVMKGDKAEGFFIRNPYAFLADKKRSIPLSKSFIPVTELDKFVDSVCSRFMEGQRKSGLAVGIIHKGNKFEYYFGEPRKGSGQAINGQTLFEIGSVTKIFTAYLFASACSENLLSPDKSLSRALAEMQINAPGISGDVKLIHLTNHTSGLPRLPKNFLDQQNYSAKYPYRNYTKELLKAYLESAKNIKPTEGSQYSNLGPSVMGMLLEHHMKSDYELLVQKRIFSAVNMPSSFVHVKKSPQDLLATPYDEKGEPTEHFEFDAMAPAGSIVSCLPDMMNFLEFMRDTSAMPQRMMLKKTLGNARFNFGMGWMIQPTFNKNTLVWHNGATYGFTSFVGFVREKDIGIVVLCNQSAPVDKVALDVIKFLERK